MHGSNEKKGLITVNWLLVRPVIAKVGKLLGIFFIVVLLGAAAAASNRYYFDSSHVDHELMLKYLSALKWPILFFVIFILTKPYHKDIVNRIEWMGKDGLKLRAPGPQSTERITTTTETEGDSTAAKIDIATSGGRAKLMDENSEVRWELEKVYRVAYGTQIKALNALAGMGDRGLTSQELMPYYQYHQKIAQLPHADFGIWMLFLTNNLLVVNEPGTDIYKITNIGRLFLEYLTRESISTPELKPN